MALVLVSISTAVLPPASMAQSGTTSIENGSDEPWEYVQVTWSTDPEDSEAPLTQPLEPGDSVAFEFSSADSGCFYNVMAEGEEGYYAGFILNFCVLDEVRLTEADFASYDPDPDELGVEDLIADALLRLGTSGFAELSPHLDFYHEGCADGPTAIGNDPMGWTTLLCPDGGEVVGKAMGSGELVFVQEMEWIEAENDESADEFVEFLAQEVHENLRVSCGPLRMERVDRSVRLTALDPACAPAAIVFDWVAREGWQGSHLIRLLVLRL